MKKKLLCLLLVLTLFTVIGCGNKNDNIDKTTGNKVTNMVTIGEEQFKLDSSADLYSLHYKRNFVDFYTDAIGDMRTMSYTKDDNLVFEVRVMYDEGRSVSELKAITETQTGASATSKVVNGIEYVYYEYTSTDGLTVHHYIYAYNGKAYSIGFFLGESAGNIEEVFMNGVSFE